MNRQELEAKLAELESDLKLWNSALSRKLEESVRKTTLAFIQKGEALRTQYIEALADQVPGRLRGLGHQIETERRAIEYQGLRGDIEVFYEKDSFWACLQFGDKKYKYSESYIKGRITDSLFDISKTDHFVERKLEDLYASKGFKTMCSYIESLMAIKIEKCKMFNVPFQELEIGDVYKKTIRSNDARFILFTMAVSHVLWKLKQQQTA